MSRSFPTSPPAQQRSRLVWLSAAAALLVASVAVAGTLGTLRHFGATGHFADADDIATVRFGKRIYAERCASCHGRSLQGQPLWQLADRYAGRRAPALDQNGPTWRQTDEALFAVTKYGGAAHASGQRASAMPPFEGVLDDNAILAVIAFIKARWPVGLRVLQAMRNPGEAGMPSGAHRTDWTFPADCMVPGQRAR